MDYISYNLINSKTSSSSSSPIFIPSSYSRKAINSRNGKKKALNIENTNNKTTTNTTTTTNDNNNKKGRVRLSTDPQSVAARERRHRISDRFKMLQNLIPGGAKLDTVSMLEQAIQYVKYLKAQILLHETIVNNSNKVNNYNHNNYNNKRNDNKTTIYQDQYCDRALVYGYNDNSTSNTSVNDAYYHDQYRYALMNDNNNNYHVSYQQLQGGDGVGGVNGEFFYDHQKMINMAATVTPNQAATPYQDLWGYQEYGLAPNEDTI